MLLPVGVEVRAGSREVGRVALAHIMDVEGMLSRRQVLELYRKVHAVRSGMERDRPDFLPVGIP